jgi:hypothetical protein
LSDQDASINLTRVAAEALISHLERQLEEMERIGSLRQPGGLGYLRRLYWRSQFHLQSFTYNLLWWVVVRQQRSAHREGWRPPTSMILSYLGFPCYVVAVVIAFWSPVATLIICGALWLVWTIMAPTFSAE